ncbi:MAG: hypothetical protein ACT4QF_08530 [Sporichthyaceae bacterium]
MSEVMQTLAVGVLGLALLSTSAPVADPNAAARGTLQVCVIGKARDDVSVWAEGLSARADRLRPDGCLVWRVREGVYDFGIGFDGPATIAYNHCAVWAVSRPGLFRQGDGGLPDTTHVAAGARTRIDWAVGGACGNGVDFKRPSGVDAAATASEDLERTGPPDPSGTLRVCREDAPPGSDSNSYGQPIHFWADGPVGRSVRMPAGERICHDWALPAGEYLLGTAETEYDLASDNPCSADPRPRDHVAPTRREPYPSVPAVYVVPGETTLVTVDANCPWEG